MLLDLCQALLDARSIAAVAASLEAERERLRLLDELLERAADLACVTTSWTILSSLRSLLFEPLERGRTTHAAVLDPLDHVEQALVA
jgi:hypothetical protein